MITDLWVQIFGVRSEKGYGKSYILVWNRVRVLRTVRHTPPKFWRVNPPPPRTYSYQKWIGENVLWSLLGVVVVVWYQKEVYSPKSKNQHSGRSRSANQVTGQCPWELSCHLLVASQRTLLLCSLASILSGTTENTVRDADHHETVASIYNQLVANLF